MNTQKFIEILRGNFEYLIEDKPKAVKIFLSSTFADTHAERDYLIEHVYPRLRDYCKKTYELEFQVYDMRWGISSEITNSHMTTTVCLNEIKNCQKFSAGPNFIAFLSHRYGARSLPTRIIADEYKILEKESKSLSEKDKNFIHNDEENKINLEIENLIEFCYELDDNETPSRYRLKHIEKIIPNYNGKNPEISKIWEKIELKLGNLFRNVADICLEKKLISKTEHERYFVSVTEKEIFNGILRSKNVNSNVLYFQRDIVDIEENLTTNISLVKRFIEIDKNNQVDEPVKFLLDKLKYEKIPNKLSESNIFKFKVKWDKNEGISLKSHPEYIKQFGDIFFEQVKKLIDQNQHEAIMNNLSINDKELLQEILDHARFCKETVSKFHGRNDVFEKIKNYILDKENNVPFVVHGESGCGKTAILAKFMSEIPKIVPDPHNYSLLLRFLGTTPISSDIIKTIKTIIIQLNRIFDIQNKERKIITELDAQIYLLETLEFITTKFCDKKIVIILDSIDQLNPVYYSLNWLINKLPSNVKMIYSTLPNHGNILSNLNKILDHEVNENNFLEVLTVDPALAEFIILNWLKNIQRHLSQTQLEIIKDLFTRSILYPLYIKLIFDIISKWTSYYVPEDEFLKCQDIDQCIEYIFKSMEKIHGKMLFSRTVIYMTLFKNGICESELEDVLCLDDDVLYDIFEFHAPPVRKLPIALWARIKNDLKEYMVEKEIDNSRVIYWYHRRFIEVANRYYISGIKDEERSTIFSNVVDFFNETWKYKPKPYKYNQYLAKKFDIKNGESEAKRDTSLQPTVIIEQNGKIRFNKRKLTELPSFIAEMTSNISNQLASKIMYFDFYFLLGLFYFIPFVDIFENLSKICDNSSYSLSDQAKIAKDQISIFRLTILQCGSLMKNNPSASLIHFLSRTLNYNNYYACFTDLINEYDKESPKIFPLILTHQYLEPPSGDLLFQLDKHTMPITHTIMGGEENQLVMTLSNKINIFDIQWLKDLGEINIPKSNFKIEQFIGYLESFNIDEKPSLIDLKGGFILTYKNEIKNFGFDSTRKSSIKFKDRSLKKVLLLSDKIVLVCFENEDYIEFYDLNNSQIIKTIKFDSKIRCLNSNFNPKFMLNLDDKVELILAVGFDNGDVRVYEISSTDLETNLENIKLIKSVPSPGFNSFLSVDFVFNTEENYSELLFISYGNFNFGYMDINERFNFIFISRNIKNLDLKAVHLDRNRLLLLGTNKNLYLFDTYAELCFEINGNFSDGCLIDSKLIGIEDKNLIFFTISNQNDNFKIAKLATFEGHDEEITFLCTIQGLIMTASKDSTLKIFFPNKIETHSEIKFNFHKAVNEINELVYINEEYLVSQMKNSNQLHIWNKPSGKIIHTLVLDCDEKILKLYNLKSNMVIVLSEYKSQKILLRFYNIKNENSPLFSLEEISKKEVNIPQKSDVRFIKSNNDIFILHHELNSSKIFINKLNESTSVHAKKKQNISIDLSSKIAYLNKQSLIENFTITNLNQILALFYDQNLYFIQSTTGDILNWKNVCLQDMNIEYFLTPINIPLTDFKSLTPIDNTDNLIMLDNIGYLHYVEYFYKQNEIKSFKSTNLIFKSFKINKNLLLAHDKINSQLICYELNNVFNQRSFKNFYFQIDLGKDITLNHYNFSIDNEYVFTIEEKKHLKFHVLNKNKIEDTAELMMYAEVMDVLCTNDFISLAIKDKKVISYLISDKKNLEKTWKKIKQLPSRCELNNEIKDKNDIISKRSNVLDESSDEEIDLDEIFDGNDESDKHIREKLRDVTILLEPLKIFKEEIELEDLKSDWGQNLMKKNFGLSQIKENNINNDPENVLYGDNFEVKNGNFASEGQYIIESLKNSKKQSLNTKNISNNVKVTNNYSSYSCLIQ